MSQYFCGDNIPGPNSAYLVLGWDWNQSNNFCKSIYIKTYNDYIVRDRSKIARLISRTFNVQICRSFGKLFSLKILVILAIKLHLLKPFSSLSIYGTIHSLNHTNLGLFRASFQICQGGHFLVTSWPNICQGL